MTDFIIDRTDDTPLSFSGEQIASVSGKPDYNPVLWTDYVLFKTDAGSFICQKLNHTRLQGERYTEEAIVAKNHTEIVEFFGLNNDAKEIYCIAKIDIATKVD
ncbi:MAG: hypothetical protein RPR28_06365 [Cycloclasticus sp.]